MIVIKDLKDADLFKGLNTRQLHLFGKHFTEVNFKAGETIFTQGEPAQNLYIFFGRRSNLGHQGKR